MILYKYIYEQRKKNIKKQLRNILFATNYLRFIYKVLLYCEIITIILILK